VYENDIIDEQLHRLWTLTLIGSKYSLSQFKEPLATLYPASLAELTWLTYIYALELNFVCIS
jgi:hypothetical protein